MRDTIMSVAEQKEPFGKPAAGSVFLHVGFVGLIAIMIFANDKFHGNQWGVNGPQGTIQANLVNSAPSIPLPSITPPTPNVLATQTPSPAPAPPSKEVIPITPPDAIPLAAHKPKLRPAEKPQPASPQHAQPTPAQNRAQYGEAASTNMAHAMSNAEARNNAPVQVQGGDFAARFPWYVDKITRLVSQNWYTYQIDSSTRYGSQVSITFTIHRDGSVDFSSINLPQPSPSPSLNKTAREAVQRVGSFGPLPDQYTGKSVSVEYTFTYDQPAK
ncbi:MAG TPA: TonB family protein [Acidobacteriaceae bacterium]|nr:TonB family protein [Acidobacteriaceae bacterium]